jgi:putative oxidoreductase
MKEQTISRLAIILLALVMAVFGIYHFVYPQNLLAYVPSFLPDFGNLWVYIPGAAFILAAVAFITNKMVKTAAYLLAALLIIFVLTIHLPNFLNGSNDEYRQLSLINLLKDTAIAAFALHIAANSPN